MAASDATAPPPTKINGFLAALIISIAFSMSSSRISSVSRSIGCGSFGSYSQAAAVTSLVISTRTGPGRPLLAITNARRITSASFVTSFTIKLYFVIGMVTPRMSISWKLSFPRRPVVTLQVMATIGMESRLAVAIPVTRFVAPGPDVAIHTPTLPVALA